MDRFFLKKKLFSDKKTIDVGPKLDLMLSSALPATFNEELWIKISSIQPSVFIKNQ